MPAFEHALLLMMCRKIQIVTFCSRSAMMNVSGLLHTQQEVGGSTSFTTEALGKTETQSTISWTDNEASEFYPLAFRTLGGHRAQYQSMISSAKVSMLIITSSFTFSPCTGSQARGVVKVGDKKSKTSWG